jgi:uncharacterized protein YcfL
MKKMLFASAVLGLLSFSACDTKKADTKEDDKTVVERDSVATEYEVTEKVVETDTTTKTRTVDVDKDKKDKK